ncbi:50S ribosomal protein L19 [Candidatus Peribacteria bacterium RIFCSPLOWO2_01_FULL_51_18]|nr:MAG: 50S ribosomal protein L19 [Candidatus Peribacteria bacterium RIFCSPHIGHO2_02_FULL_51_15]OGJ66518.1 MAG: 50S ribosomal protein L19 [Candidatus Peribacteria bacterium RIFCSPLOWO2_01_FULL_51_18]OGJ67458.1 MAG: 50S ribosomal protein L19 [Candidatus Peribacteria bacterium RIFCSPLOWO2_02_FULL_51_10]
MTGIALKEQAEKMTKNRPEIRPGFTVRVHQKVQEGDKERIQIFEGLVIGVHRGHSPTDTNFTVRRIASGVGVERVFPLHSPLIEKIEVKKVAEVRRAKLNFLRGRSGKSARISERFTSSEEFSIAAASKPVKETEIAEGEEAKKKEETEKEILQKA